MANPQELHTPSQSSPDPADHSRNIYDDSIETELDEIDDDDMDNEPQDEDDEDIEFFETLEDADTNFEDANDGLNEIEIELSMDDEGDIQETLFSEADEDIEVGEAPPQTAASLRLPQGTTREVQNTILQLLRRRGIQGLIAPGSEESGSSPDDDDDGEYDDRVPGRQRRTRSTFPKDHFPPVPSNEGRKLMQNGTFGALDYFSQVRRDRKPRLARQVLDRELGDYVGCEMNRGKRISQHLMPSSNADMIINYERKAYSGEFSADGNFYFSCSQDMMVRMYDTSNPYEWKYYKEVMHPYMNWTITDASLSPDNQFLAYSSIVPIVCLAPTNPNDDSDPWLLDFTEVDRRRQSRGGFMSRDRLGIWSVRFSGDGREIVAGTSRHEVVVYDITTKQSVLRIKGHFDDVNAVCFGDKSSPHILYSGSDDSLIKVWDRRSMGDQREAGVFVGHTEGITYVDSKGDGRYVLSNGKDQSMKLWDLRKMTPPENVDSDPTIHRNGYDYRFMSFSESNYRKHPNDCSLVTFQGHKVLKTLIRCHFSPPGSTDSRYVFSGSACGNVHVWNIDATLVGKIDVYGATRGARGWDPHEYRTGKWQTCVRDVSWHPNVPMVAATSWNGYNMSNGTCSVHSWNEGVESVDGGPQMGRRVNEKLEHEDRFYRTKDPSRRSHLRSRLVSQVDAGENGW